MDPLLWNAIYDDVLRQNYGPRAMASAKTSPGGREMDERQKLRGIISEDESGGYKRPKKRKQLQHPG